MADLNFGPELVAGFVGVALSWLFAWFPGLRTWFASLRSEVKSAIMLCLLAVCSVGIYFLSKYGVIPVSKPITWQEVIIVFFVSSTLNQTAYKLIPQLDDVKEIKTARTVMALKEVEPEVLQILTSEDKK